MIKIKETMKNGYEKVKEHVVRNRGTYGYFIGGMTAIFGGIVYEKIIGKIETGSLQVEHLTKDDEWDNHPIVINDEFQNKSGRVVKSFRHWMTVDDAEKLAGHLTDAAKACKEIENG